jgi:hypothetical protein
MNEKKKKKERKNKKRKTNKRENKNVPWFFLASFKS